jgi:hypothetical protein
VVCHPGMMEVKKSIVLERKKTITSATTTRSIFFILLIKKSPSNDAFDEDLHTYK